MTGAEKPNWESITPDLLIPAVRHIRKRYEEKEFQHNFATEKACFKNLHPVLRGSTAPMIFKRYTDMYQEALKAVINEQFRDLLQIGLTNEQILNENPVEWARSHVELLITDDHYKIKTWIKNVCDQQELPKNSNSEEDVEEYIGWHSWRAPKLIHMHPSGNTPYDPATEWSRDNEEQTKNILAGLSNRFIDSLDFHLKRLAGEAYVQLAKDGRKIQEHSAQKQSGSVEPERPDEDAPVVFISYSWDSEPHKQWVLELASRLQTQGVRVILDRWNLVPGGDRTFFMEDSVSKSKFVVLVCTPLYAKRANNREGGVGYEATIITGELAKNIKQAKFIPVLRDGDWDSSFPRWIQTKLGVDLRRNPYSESQYEALLRALHDEPLKPPPLGSKPPLEQNQSSVDSAPVPKTQQVSSPVPLKFSNGGGTPGPILVSGSEHAATGPWMILRGLVTVVNCALVPVKFTPIRLLIDGTEWSVHKILFKRTRELKRLESVYLDGNHQEDLELHFMFPDDHYPQSLSGELLIHINENEPLSVPVKFP